MNHLLVLLSIVGLLAPAMLQDYSCTGGTSTYTIYAIDGYTQGQPTACTYRVYLQSGKCSIGTDFTLESRASYVCFGRDSGGCSSADVSSLQGFVTQNCAGTYKAESFNTVTNYGYDLEYTMSTSIIQIRIAIGYNCSTGSTWYARQCGSPTPNQTTGPSQYNEGADINSGNYPMLSPTPTGQPGPGTLPGPLPGPNDQPVAKPSFSGPGTQYPTMQSWPKQLENYYQIAAQTGFAYSTKVGVMLLVAIMALMIV